MKEHSYEQVDDLFAQIRLRVGQVRQSDPEIADELKGLITQLEVWVESLVINSLKLRSLESGAEKPIKSETRRRERPGGK